MGNLSFLVFFLALTSSSLAAPSGGDADAANLGDLFGMMGALSGGDAQDGQPNLGALLGNMAAPQGGEAPERQANLGDLFGMMGGLMTAMAPEEDAKEIQQQMGEITQLLGGIGLAPAGPDSGAEAPTGLFSEPVDACLQYFNNEVISGITLEECKEKCSSAISFVCRSLDYEGSESRCLLSEESKKTQPSSYFEPCYDGTHSTYLEQIFTDSVDVSLDLSAGTEAFTAAQPTGLFSDPVDACLQYFNNEIISGITLEECKEKCSYATSYVCHSLEYEQRCLLSEESKKTQPRSYKEPCYDGTHSTYLEQIFTDSANVSLDLNAGAEASTAAQPTGLFSEPVDACLQYFNNEIIEGITLEECKEKCSSATSFVCHSLEYEQGCLLSEESKKTQPRAYTEPCYDGTHSTYLEQIFTDGCYEEDTDYYGNDINMNTGRNEDRKESPAECQELCTQTEGCKFFTWKQYSKECWSKTVGGYGKGHHEIGSVSGPRNCGDLDSARASSQLESSQHCWVGIGAWCTWGPQFAIDGVIQTSYGKIFHSNQENYPWFEVELRNSTNISSVTIYNRPDCCGERFKNAEIRVGMTRVPDGTIGQLLNINTICGTYAGPGANGEEMRIDCASPIMATFITVQLKDINAVLQINEIRINING